MSNESKTLNLFRSKLRDMGYYDNPDIVIEEQKSDSKAIDKLLKHASKSGEGCGYPDFIIHSRKYSDFIIVVECKAEISRHSSETLDSYNNYAVDGALLYSSFLSREFDVVAIGFSGEQENLCRISHYLQITRDHRSYPYFDHADLLSFDDYYNGLKKSQYKFNQDFSELISYTKELNEVLHAMKIKESKRALLISAIMIALKNERFKAEYTGYPSHDILISNMYDAVCFELDKSDVPDRNKMSLKASYEFLMTNTVLSDPKNHLFVTNLINECDKRINGFMVTHKYIDTVSHFSVEFLRYANNDKGLGIVLTPPHITELFTELAEVNKDSIVLDNCAGTGGFLVSAMKKMLKDAGGRLAKEEAIKDKQLVGIEFDDEIYTLLISNMIMHRDGRTNIMLGDTLNEADCKTISKTFHPTVGLLNPPYKNKKRGTEELKFVLANLSMLEKGGRCIALVPLSCVIETKGTAFALKQLLLEGNRLEGVLSLPEELFANSKVNTVTCAVILTAGIPHPKGYKTWFGYCREDGFVKKKNIGRIDFNHTWPQIKEKWVNAFLNRDEISEFSVKKEVTADMEWCAEAYLQADYSQLSADDFTNTVKNYLLYNIHTHNSQSITEEQEGNEL